MLTSLRELWRSQLIHQPPVALDFEDVNQFHSDSEDGLSADYEQRKRLVMRLLPFFPTAHFINQDCSGPGGSNMQTLLTLIQSPRWKYWA
jgi:hypothetical protein